MTSKEDEKRVWIPKVGDYVRSRHAPRSAGEIRQIETREGQPWLSVITTSGWERGCVEHFVLLEEPDDCPSPCAECGAPNAPYLEHRCMLHYGGQTRSVMPCARCEELTEQLDQVKQVLSDPTDFENMMVTGRELVALRREVERLKKLVVGDTIEACAQEAERNIIEYSEIDLLDTMPERLRIARRIRAMACAKTPSTTQPLIPEQAPRSNCKPMQPLELVDGVMRFKANTIVGWLLDRARSGRKTDLNDIAREDFPQDDWEQFAQLIGYSVDGYCDLSYVSEETAASVSEAAAKLLTKGTK